MTANEARALSKGREDFVIGGVVDRHILQAVREGKTECVVSSDEFPKDIAEDVVLNWIHVKGFTGGPVCDILPDANYKGLLCGKFKGYIIRW